MNKEIALLSNWLQDTSQKWTRWNNPNTRRWQNNPPDYEDDWGLTGPLLEELPDDVHIEITLNTIPNSEGNGKFRCALVRNLTMLGVGVGDTRKAASAHAWYVWKKNERGDE